MPVGLEQHAGRVLGARYRLLTPLGAGASAVVYLAEDLTLRRRVAVKILHPALSADDRFRRRFRAEAHASAQLSHPHIVAVFDWADAETQPDGQIAPAFLVSELLTGGSLRSVLDRCPVLSVSQALLIGLQAAQGLAHAHDRGFVHRDIKPANLLFDEVGRLRIADFGIARAVAEAAWTEPEQSLVGTARYAAPEQAAGGTVDGRSDVYSLAVTLIESVTGEVPLSAPTALATMVARQGVDLPVTEALGPLAPVLREAGRAHVEARMTAGQLAEALLGIAPSLPRPEPLALVVSPRSEPHPSTGPDPGPDPDSDSGPDPTIDLRTAPVLDPTTAFPVPDGEEPPEVAPRVRHRWASAIGRSLLVVGVAAALGGAAYGATQFVDREPEVVVSLTHPVGAFVGRAAVAVEAEIVANQWRIARTTTRADGFEKGTIVRQSPAPGTALAEGAEVTLVISDGFELRPVPQLEGLPRSEALAALSTAGLLMGGTGEEYSETVPRDVIIRASVPVGTEVEGKTTVDLVWSLGPEPRTISEFVGQLGIDAVAALAGAGLVVEEIDEYSLSVAEGLVILVNPPAGQLIEKGGAVTVVISLGLPFVTVPDVAGLSAVEAAEVLADEGFEVVDTVGPPNAEVLATSPPAGEAARQGSDVVIFTRQKKS